MTTMDADQPFPFTPSHTSDAPRGILATLRLTWGAVRGSLFAYRRYEHLRTKGTPHRTAISRALGTSSSHNA
jgi:hypothetical protein